MSPIVEEDRPAARAAEEAFLRRDRSGERAAQVAEQLALEQRLGIAAQFTGRKILLRSWLAAWIARATTSFARYRSRR